MAVQRTERSAPAASIPPNSELPASVRQLADEWRTADDRVKDIQRTYSEAMASLGQAQLDDAEALGAAVLAGQPLPPDRENENAVRATITDAERRLPIARRERDTIGNRLAVALRDTTVRQHIADHTAERIRPALAAYLAALDDAERTVRDAHRTLTESTGNLTFLDALDRGTQLRVAPSTLDGLPTFSAARSAAQKLSQRVDRIGERQDPRHRHVRLSDGREVHVPAELAAMYARDGIVDAWLDGWPPQEPAPQVGDPARLAARYGGTQGRFVRREDRAA